MQKGSAQGPKQDETLKNIVECQDIQYSIGNFDCSVKANQVIPAVKTQNKDSQRLGIHLKQTTKANPEWTYDEEKKLFELQEIRGNKWKLISSELSGQRDHIVVKNYFYATLRKSIRIINNFICQHRQQQSYRTFKTFPENCIGKIIAQDQNKKRDKMRVTKDNISISAKEIKRRLLQISRTPNDRDQIEQAITQISQFNKNCRRLRSKNRRSASNCNIYKTQNTSKRSQYLKNKKLNSEGARLQQDQSRQPQQQLHNYIQSFEQNQMNLSQMVNEEEQQHQNQLDLPENLQIMKKQNIRLNSYQQIKDADDYEKIANKMENAQIKNNSYFDRSITAQKNNAVIEVQDILLMSPFFQQPANLATMAGRNFDEYDPQQQIYSESVEFS